MAALPPAEPSEVEAVLKHPKPKPKPKPKPNPNPNQVEAVLKAAGASEAAADGAVAEEVG